MIRRLIILVPAHNGAFGIRHFRRFRSVLQRQFMRFNNRNDNRRWNGHIRNVTMTILWLNYFFNFFSSIPYWIDHLLDLRSKKIKKTRSGRLFFIFYCCLLFLSVSVCFCLFYLGPLFPPFVISLFIFRFFAVLLTFSTMSLTTSVTTSVTTSSSSISTSSTFLLAIIFSKKILA